MKASTTHECFAGDARAELSFLVFGETPGWSGLGPNAKLHRFRLTDDERRPGSLSLEATNLTLRIYLIRG